jgi:GNAT superfamily N-acetyltransferase
MIEYIDSLENVTAGKLEGFFVGWPNPPSGETHLKILEQSYYVVLAVDTETDRVIGFVNAISDGLFCAYLPLLEVLPEYQKRGIGKELMRRVLARFEDMYMVDLLCDPDLQPFYKKLGMKPVSAMMIRNFERQCGPKT